MAAKDFGIKCFHSDNLHVFGEIKSKSSDFEVHELDLDGNIAGITSKVAGNDKKISDDMCALDFEATCTPNSNDEIPQKHEELNPLWLKVFKDHLVYLNEVIGENKFQKLLTIDIHSFKTVSMGIFNEKLTRATLHECVRYLFPHIVIQPDLKENNDVENETYDR